ncbi:DUF441 domain-containing protein [Jeotgalibacillus malaysiensis]|uniref:DUF441 domain-containing protein n=1 Tax=Jeotgalibacillus malaysiensis TaxID=1508404 RepID=UPI003850A3D5
MINPAMIFLILLLAIGFFAKNNSLMIAVLFLILLKVAGADEKIFAFIQGKGINWGVTIITIAVLAPIASGAIGFKELTDAVKLPYAWVALATGIAVALIAKGGISLLQEDPHITVALVFGTILAVALFNGIAVGPLIGAGIAYSTMKIFEWVSKAF